MNNVACHSYKQFHDKSSVSLHSWLSYISYILHDLIKTESTSIVSTSSVVQLSIERCWAIEQIVNKEVNQFVAVAVEYYVDTPQFKSVWADFFIDSRFMWKDDHRAIGKWTGELSLLSLGPGLSLTGLLLTFVEQKKTFRCAYFENNWLRFCQSYLCFCQSIRVSKFHHLLFTTSIKQIAIMVRYALSSSSFTCRYEVLLSDE